LSTLFLRSVSWSPLPVDQRFAILYLPPSYFVRSTSNSVHERYGRKPTRRLGRFSNQYLVIYLDLLRPRIALLPALLCLTSSQFSLPSPSLCPPSAPRIVLSPFPCVLGDGRDPVCCLLVAHVHVRIMLARDARGSGRATLELCSQMNTQFFDNTS
jgi:hypothetical protein